MTAINELLARHAKTRDLGHPEIQTPVPSLGLTIVTCMDARIKVFDVFGLKHGEAHILRNAGGIVTEDVIRSLTISQRLLGTREVIVVQHTNCGLSQITDDDFKTLVEEDTGLRPTWAVEAFREVKDSVRVSVERVRRSAFLPSTDNVRGFVYDVATGLLDEVV
ncbi:carbonic anhydrase [Allokutzneria sp. A3M-2-11 16]|uniref:beta-class carbonic anhydrase n=1 Tax=Allokutzneria sp. A3M-2-11 16 TaxID=2962043 RepID=UPI0020B6A658|nr:carbonic anhydrase [Allokutzneria sp. A3M-2-11 16]MCP3799952.1 carbonic anhydrase [Allokutzneria sp. A3M-2-11 16]